MAVSLCVSVWLSVRYRNHFPVVRFQNQAHIWNPHGTGHVFKPFGAPKAAQIFFFSFTAAEGGGCPNGRRRHPNGGAEGAAPPEGEGNPAEGGSSRVYTIHIYKFNIYLCPYEFSSCMGNPL